MDGRQRCDMALDIGLEAGAVIASIALELLTVGVDVIAAHGKEYRGCQDQTHKQDSNRRDKIPAAILDDVFENLHRARMLFKKKANLPVMQLKTRGAKARLKQKVP